MFSCKCGREFEKKSSLKSHARFCSDYEKETKSSKYKQDDGSYKCECGKTYEKAQSLNAHLSHCLVHRDGEPPVNRWKESCAWSKGLTKETDERIKKNAENLSKILKDKYKRGELVQHKHSKEFREKMSELRSLNPTNIKCKWYDVNGQNVQGTWERDFIIKCNDCSVECLKITSRSKSLKYIKDGIFRTYTPDFYLPEFDIFIEIKGYWWLNDKEKMKLVFEQNKGLNDKLLIVKKSLYYKLIKMENTDFKITLKKISKNILKLNKNKL